MDQLNPLLPLAAGLIPDPNPMLALAVILVAGVLSGLVARRDRGDGEGGAHPAKIPMGHR